MSELRRLMMAKKLGGGLPSGVVLYDRLIGDGVAYIDTGLVFTNDDILRIAFGKVTMNKSAYHLFGASSNDDRQRIQWASTGTAYISMLSQERQATSVNIKDDVTIEFGTLKTSSSWNIFAKYNDRVVYNESFSPFGLRTAERTFLLFANRQNGSTAINTNRNPCEIKYMDVLDAWDTSIVKYYFHPCTYNGVAGMWDMVNNVFHGNANTSGSFSVANN